MTAYEPTSRTRVRRAARRAVYDRAAVHAILDEALGAHVAFLVDGEPRVLPTAIARVGEAVDIHGHRRSQMIRSLEEGSPACLAVTLLDGIVVARSGFHSSMNDRSVVIHARGEPVEGDAKIEALDLPVWAGVVPLELRPGTPEPDPGLDPSVPLPDYLDPYRR